jgi:hypothetical protein
MATVTTGYTFVNNETVTPAKLNSLAGSATVTNIQTSDISDSQITTAKIADSNVTTAKIADSNVTTAKIADSNVTTAKIADSNVTTAKIADSNVTTAKIADSAITSAKIADGAIVTAGLANNAVTAAKLGANEQKQIAHAWVNFSGATGTIRNSYNCSSVTRTGTGQYRVNFTTYTNSVNYAFACTCGNGTENPSSVAAESVIVTNTLNSYLQLMTVVHGSNASDLNWVTAIIFQS